MTASRYLRQRRLQQVAIDALRRDPSLIGDPRIAQRLDAITDHVFGEPYVQCVETWRTLLDSGDIDAVTRTVLADTDLGGYMRAVSPLGVLITDEQRRAVIYSSRY